MSCRVIHDGQLINNFEVRTGVRQGCLLSPFLFILAIVWIMKTETKGKRNGIQWKILTQLDDLDFADDLALMSHSHRSIGLKIHKKKTKIPRLNTICERPIMVEGEGIEELESFRYLCSIVDTRGGTEADVKTRISKARAAFHILKNVWKSRVIGKTSQIRLFNTNVKSVLLYGAETWRMNKTTLKRIQTFVNQYLRKILVIQWMDKVGNKDLWERTNQVQIEIEILKRRWGWFGHTLRKPNSNITRPALTLDPQGKRKRGRPKNTWRRDLEVDITQTGLSWKQLERIAQDRRRWRDVVHGLCSRRSQVSMTRSTVLPNEQDDDDFEVGRLRIAQLVDHVGRGMATPLETTREPQEHVDGQQDRLCEEDHSSEPCALRRSARQTAGQHSNPNILPRATNVKESRRVSLVLDNHVDPAVFANIAETQLMLVWLLTNTGVDK